MIKPTIEENCIVKTGKWSDFSNTIKNINRFHSNIINVDKLKNYLTGLEKTYKKGTKFFRGRISNDEKGFDIDEIGAPPIEFAKSGRANSAGIAHLYLASDKETAVREIRASLYDFITIGEFELTKDVVVINLQNIDKMSPFYYHDEDMAVFAVNKRILHDINNEMAKPVRNNTKFIEYVPTQFIADYILSLGIYHGIEYKSTMNAEGFNLALFDTNIAECIGVENITIDDIKYEYKDAGS